MSFYTDHKNKKVRSLRSTNENNIILIMESTPKVPAKNSDINRPGKRAAIFTSLKKASFTVEAALILPLFLLFCLTIFSMLNFYSLYVSESTALKDKAEKAAVYAYDSDHIIDTDGYLTLTKPVRYKVPYSPVPLPALKASCHARVHAWCGYLGTGITADHDSSGEMVYVTDYESVYHTDSSCSHLDLHIFTRPLKTARKSRNIDGVRYHACERCIRNSGASQQVYLSERGTAYHNSLECSGLKRSVRLIDKSQVSGLRECSRCSAQNKQQGDDDPR